MHRVEEKSIKVCPETLHSSLFFKQGLLTPHSALSCTTSSTCWLQAYD